MLSERRKTAADDPLIVDWFVCAECLDCFKENQQVIEVKKERKAYHLICWEAKNAE